MVSREPVRVEFLGGLGEIGRNAALVSQGLDAMLIDFGVMFPKADMPGVDLVLPDFRAISDREIRLHGVVVTHGHEDHIGGLPYLLREVPAPVYGSRFTIELVSARLKEHKLLASSELVVVEDYGTVQIGPFRVELIPVTHSVPDAMSVAVYTSEGVIFHTGDFKIDSAPVDHRQMGLSRLAVLGREQGIRLLLSDSTNAEEGGYTASESSVFPSLAEIFYSNPGKRIVIACFASHLHRILQITQIAELVGRKVVFMGRSLKRNVSLGVDLGIIPKRILDESIEVERIDAFDPEEICVIATGSQGEQMAVLHTLAFQPERFFKIGENDLVIFSSDVIPGNESAVNRLINQFARLGVRSIYPPMKTVHASGHAKREELATVLSLASPEFFIPVHGEYRQMSAHADLARKLGVVTKEVLVCQDGEEIVLSGNGLERHPTGYGEYLYVDGVVGDVSRGLLRDRRVLSEDGVVVVAVTVDSAGVLQGAPEMLSIGWVHDEREEELLDEVGTLVAKYFEGLVGPLGEGEIREELKRRVGKFVRERTKRRPMIVSLITEV